MRWLNRVVCVCVCLGVWGSAFSILFNRVIGVKETTGCSSTMEEELGRIGRILFLQYDYLRPLTYCKHVENLSSVSDGGMLCLKVGQSVNNVFLSGLIGRTCSVENYTFFLLL